jgi:hypothetical protein
MASARIMHRKHRCVLLRAADHIENTASYIVASVYYLAMAVSVDRQFLHGVNTPQYDAAV